MANKLKITMTGSAIGRNKSQRGALRALGLKKIRQSVVQPDNPSTRGQIEKISHIVTVETVSE